jgi:predicted metal-binding protein
MNASIRLTEAEMATLDDGQGWYKPGDRVDLGGDIAPDHDSDGDIAGTLDLCVNGKAHDNWIEFRDLPGSIQSRMVAEIPK